MKQYKSIIWCTLYIIWCTPSIIWWIGGCIIWWTGYIIWWTGYIIWWIPFFDKFAISLVFNSPRIKEFEFIECCEIVFSISHSMAELFMLFSFGWLGVHHMMDRGGHHMMDGVHYMMDGVHYMMDRVHHMMDRLYYVMDFLVKYYSI